MNRRSFVAIVGVSAVAGCTGNTGADGAGDESGWDRLRSERVIGDTSFAHEFEAGDELRLQIVNDRGYVTFVSVFPDSSGEAVGEFEVKTEAVEVVEIPASDIYHVFVSADEIAEITLARRA